MVGEPGLGRGHGGKRRFTDPGVVPGWADCEKRHGGGLPLWKEKRKASFCIAVVQAGIASIFPKSTSLQDSGSITAK